MNENNEITNNIQVSNSPPRLNEYAGFWMSVLGLFA